MLDDNLPVWIGIGFIATTVLGATFYVPLLAVSLLGLALLTISSVFVGIRQ